MSLKILDEMRKDKGFYPWGTEPEVCEVLQSLVKLTRAKNILDLGTFKGASAISMAEAVKSIGGGKVYTVDIKDFCTQNIKKSGLEEYIEFHCEDDLEFLRKNNFQWDLVFIDTTHEHYQTLKEFHLVSERLKPGGLIVFHDAVAHEGVRMTISFIVSRDDYQGITLPTPILDERPVFEGNPSGLAIVRKWGGDV